MGNAVFLDVVPEFEIKDGLSFTKLSDGAIFCASIATLRLAVAKAERVLAEHDRKPGNVFPACQCCEKRPH